MIKLLALKINATPTKHKFPKQTLLSQICFDAYLKKDHHTSHLHEKPLASTKSQTSLYAKYESGFPFVICTLTPGLVESYTLNLHLQAGDEIYMWTSNQNEIHVVGFESDDCEDIEEEDMITVQNTEMNKHAGESVGEGNDTLEVNEIECSKNEESLFSKEQAKNPTEKGFISINNDYDQNSKKQVNNSTEKGYVRNKNDTCQIKTEEIFGDKLNNLSKNCDNIQDKENNDQLRNKEPESRIQNDKSNYNFDNTIVNIKINPNDELAIKSDFNVELGLATLNTFNHERTSLVYQCEDVEATLCNLYPGLMSNSSIKLYLLKDQNVVLKVLGNNSVSITGNIVESSEDEEFEYQEEESGTDEYTSSYEETEITEIKEAIYNKKREEKNMEESLDSSSNTIDKNEIITANNESKNINNENENIDSKKDKGFIKDENKIKNIIDDQKLRNREKDSNKTAEKIFKDKNRNENDDFKTSENKEIKIKKKEEKNKENKETKKYKKEDDPKTEQSNDRNSQKDILEKKDKKDKKEKALSCTPTKGIIKDKIDIDDQKEKSEKYKKEKRKVTFTEDVKKHEKDEKLKIEILVQGNGTAVRKGDVVKVHYKGMLKNGTVFDQTKKKPFIFQLGKGYVIKGWDVGILGMKPGEKRRLVCAPEYGYGNQQQGPIPANSTLIFEVTLLI